MNWRRKKQKHPCRDLQQAVKQLRRWYTTELGQLLAQQERDQVDALLANMFGYHLVQLGRPGNGSLTSNTRIPHCLLLDHSMLAAAEAGAGVCVVGASSEAVPVATDSVDVVLLPHTLEYSREPHQVLREVDRMLIPEGHVLILGFNPFSPWQLWKLLPWRRRRAPWCGRFFSVPRVRDWLSLLGFDVEYSRCFFFRPPLQSARLMGRLQFMERLGRRLWPIFGGAFIVVGKKRVTTLTPIKPRWKPRRSIIPAGVVEPQGRTPPCHRRGTESQ